MPDIEARANNKWLLLGLGGAAAIGLASLIQRKPRPSAARWFEPTIETRLHVVNKQGMVEADPAGLAQAARVPLDQYVLASTMQSEEKTDKGRLAVGRAVWNVVKGDRTKLVKRLIPSGHLGSQTFNPYAASSKPPTARTLQLAAAIIEGRVPDFVDGAIQWDAPRAQDRNHQLFLKDPAKYPKYRFDSKAIAERRTKKGATMVIVPGVPETRFWSYRRKAA